MQEILQPTYHELLEKFNRQKENHRQAMKRYYNKKYKYTCGMTDDERDIIKQNRYIQHAKYKKNYELNKEYYTERNRVAREKQQNNKYLVENTNFLINTAMEKCQIPIINVDWGALNQ